MNLIRGGAVESMILLFMEDAAAGASTVVGQNSLRFYDGIHRCRFLLQKAGLDAFALVNVKDIVAFEHGNYPLLLAAILFFCVPMRQDSRSTFSVSPASSTRSTMPPPRQASPS